MDWSIIVMALPILAVGLLATLKVCLAAIAIGTTIMVDSFRERALDSNGRGCCNQSSNAFPIGAAPSRTKSDV